MAGAKKVGEKQLVAACCITKENAKRKRHCQCIGRLVYHKQVVGCYFPKPGK